MSQDGRLSPQVVDALIRREQLCLVGRLLRGVVHNISGALQMVRLPLDLLELQAQRGGEPELDPKLTALQQGVARLGEELELLAGQSQQLQKTEPESLDLGQLAREQLAFWRADMFFKHEAQVEADLPRPGSLVRAAYGDVALALNLLVANALESLAQTERRRLEVALVETPGRVGLRVSDEGPGPGPEMAARMFEPFVSDKGPGHDGLGLFLARAALARWQGEVRWVQSPPGTFEMSLPHADH